MLFLLIASVVAESIVDIVNNNPASTWKAKEYPASVITMAKFRARLGATLLETEAEKYVPSNDVPDTFDAREQWGDAILPVRNQASCGSCWAFAVAETTGDRLGILGCGRGHMSPQDLVSCDTLDLGCNGGTPLISWLHVRVTGITTEECMAYVSGDGSVPSCPKKCDNGSSIVRSKASSSSHISSSKMQSELYQNGPYEVAFNVYTDFMSYSSGVYQYTTGSLEGGHAVLLVGWGTENGTPYWLVQNSWGTDWGMDGFFKILRGSNECNIESNAYAGYFKC